MTTPKTSNLALPSRAKEAYQYHPLDPKNNEIRLLKIHPA
jgi:hypothetical protein